jgi:cysteinyl-tRNA synthetase
MQSGTTLRQTLIVRLGEFASTGLADPREARQALVDLILTLRASARAEKRWSDSDAIRDGLIAAGIEVRDTVNGVEWDLR